MNEKKKIVLSKRVILFEYVKRMFSKNNNKVLIFFLIKT